MASISSVFISGGKVVKHVAVSVNFQKFLKFGVYNYVNGSQQKFRKSQIHSHTAAFYKAEVVVLSQIGCQVEAKQSVTISVILSRKVHVFVFESLAGFLKQTYLSSRYFSGRKI